QFGYVDYNIYKDNYNIVSPLIDYAKQSENEFFRLEKTFKRSLNEPIAFGYNGIDHYSSAYNKNINTLTKKLGMAQAYFWNSYYGSTPVTDALFNVKYVINDKNAPSIFKEIKSENNYKLYKNDNVLGLCYLSSNDIKNFNFSSDFFQSQNNIINSILGDKNNTIFNTIDNNDIKQKLINVTASDSTYTKTSDDNKISYEFKAINNQPIYMDLSCGTSSKGYIYVNNKKIAQTFTNDDKNTAVYIGEFEKDENVIIDIVLKNNSVTFSDPQFYYFDTNSYKNAVNKIKQEGKVEEIFHDATSYKAKINLNKNKILMTSIPFSKSWNVYIDGKSVKPETFKNTFLYLNLSDFSSGEHEVYFKYIPQGFNIGLIISFITISFMVLFIIIKKKKINSNNK
ncbi:MAG: YfhO family protein, partial [Oscillospiraceae bacterium]